MYRQTLKTQNSQVPFETNLLLILLFSILFTLKSVYQAVTVGTQNYLLFMTIGRKLRNDCFYRECVAEGQKQTGYNKIDGCRRQVTVMTDSTVFI
jgi:hypothetical protein